MKYFTIIIQKTSDGTVANTIYSYDSEDEALEKLYSEMAYATNTKVLKSISVIVMGEDCHILKCDKWVNKAFIDSSLEIIEPQ